jgi:hypothetical protein
MGRFGNTAQGAGGGALAGAAVGSVVPGLGTAIGAGAGAIIGGLGGWFGSQGGDPAEEAYLKQLSEHFAGREASQMQDSAFRANQQQLVSMLEAQAAGQGPSMAREQLNAGVDRASRQAQGMAATVGGPNGALAQFQAQQTAANLAGQANQDASIARVAEINQARNQLGLVLQGARGQDQETSQANLEAKLRQMGINDQAQLQAIMARLGVAQTPSMGEQILAGGAGAFGMAAGQGAFAKQPAGPTPGQIAQQHGVPSAGSFVPKLF